MTDLNEQVEAHNEKEGIVKICFSCGSALSVDFANASIFDLLKISDERMYQNKKLAKDSRKSAFDDE